MIKNYFKNIKYSIKNLYKWFFIIWNDRDWDNVYIEIILHQKLINTYKFFTSEQAVTNWTIPEQQKSLKALRICINILQRRISDFYIGVLPDKTFDYKDELQTKNYINYVESIAKIEERDQQLLGKLLSQYLSYWWD